MKRTTIVFLSAVCALTLAGCAERTVARSRTASSGPTTVSSSTPGTIPAGTSLEVRTNETIDADSSAVGKIFSGQMANDIVDTSGRVLIPKGSSAQLFVHLNPDAIEDLWIVCQYNKIRPIS